MCCTSAMLGCKGLTHDPLSFILADMFPVCLFFVMVSRRRRTHMPGDSANASHWWFGIAKKTWPGAHHGKVAGVSNGEHHHGQKC